MGAARFMTGSPGFRRAVGRPAGWGRSRPRTWPGRPDPGREDREMASRTNPGRRRPRRRGGTTDDPKTGGIRREANGRPPGDRGASDRSVTRGVPLGGRGEVDRGRIARTGSRQAVPSVSQSGFRNNMPRDFPECKTPHPSTSNPSDDFPRILGQAQVADRADVNRDCPDPRIAPETRPDRHNPVHRGHPNRRPFAHKSVETAIVSGRYMASSEKESSGRMRQARTAGRSGRGRSASVSIAASGRKHSGAVQDERSE